MNGKIVARIIAALVLVASIAGIAYFAFNAGVAQGSPVTIQAPEGQTVPAPYPYYGYGAPFHRPFGHGFSFLGLLVGFFLLLTALRSLRILIWGPRWGHMHGHGPWRAGWHENSVSPMFEEWHKRAHGERPTEDRKE